VVTVEVGPQNARVWLVLGVTQQSIQCLHTMPAELASVVAVGATGSVELVGTGEK
jgi:flagellar protein FliO/FliZ